MARYKVGMYGGSFDPLHLGHISDIIKAAAMLQRHIGRTTAAQKLEVALEACPVVTTGKADGPTAADYTDALLAML